MSSALNLKIISTDVVCSVGYSSEAAFAAIDANIDHFTETQFMDYSAEPLKGAQLYGVDVWGESRFWHMLHKVLSQCIEQALAYYPSLKSTDIGLLLCFPDDRRYAPADQWIDKQLVDLCREFKLHNRPRRIHAGKAGVSIVLSEIQRFFDTGLEPKCWIAAGAESYFHSHIINHLLSRNRLITSTQADGFIPGEAAAAVALIESAAPDIVSTAFISDDETIETATNPISPALSRVIREAFQLAGIRCEDCLTHISTSSGESWYQREYAMALTRAYTRRVESIDCWYPAMSVGEIGSAFGPLGLAYWKHKSPSGHTLLFSSADDGERSATVLRS